ncbi:MAG: hypothetical protein BWY91_03029 [bacterium ADurb.BinA028]|nr:MAG: hypothetical protein BWY91_03029 [bacterium ADurb.BinA028]
MLAPSTKCRRATMTSCVPAKNDMARWALSWGVSAAHCASLMPPAMARVRII